MDKKRKCLKEITNTNKKYEDIEYGYVVEDTDLINLDIMTSEEEDCIFYKDFYLPNTF